MDANDAKRSKKAPKKQAWDVPSASSSWDNPTPSLLPDVEPPPKQTHWDVIRHMEKICH